MSGHQNSKVHCGSFDGLPDEEVVISGIAGRFPESDNVEILRENLFKSKDLITEDTRRWDLDHPEIPKRSGKVNNLEKFDALFFGTHFKQAHAMDPMCRMLLEHAYEAVADAGVNPRSLRGSKTGVYIGACYSETEKIFFYDKIQGHGIGLLGCSKAMLANRISYWLGLIGPSYTIDSACSSSLFAFENAYRAIKNGLIDAAIVGGSNLCLHPFVTLQFNRLGVLSNDGRCKPLDESADGYVRSEALGIIYLQKAKDAKRVYATVVHAKLNCDGFKEQGITYPSSAMQCKLYEDFYQECTISPKSVDYIEIHGTGTEVGDPEEMLAIEQVFLPGRTTPLKVGSVKSNLGHSEPSSGVCSIAKVIIAMETGMIPPSINFTNPRKSIKCLFTGQVKVIDKLTPLESEYVGVNSFGFGGGNAHVLLKSNPKIKVNNGKPQDDLPRLVTVSGRTEEAIDVFLNDVENQPVDVEYIALLHNLFREDTPGHLYRGYTIAGIKEPENQVREIGNYNNTQRPLWFVFSGMGSQWPGMGQSLLKFPIFAKAIEKCDAVLKPRNINIYEIITSREESIFDNILHSFVGIAAVQIGLVDLLNSVGVVPDYVIGHSVGELGCAYADGCFTAEQMILAAYSRGIASIETKMTKGSMAAVGIGYDKLKMMCPPDIEIACHNSSQNTTISGPVDSMKVFVAELQAKGIFAKEVPCNNIAYHSRYIAEAGPKLLAYLKKVIPKPKARSQKWISTSVPRDEWSTTIAQFSSAEYHTNNLLKPVLFMETSILIPENAITIEIAPHGLLQAILKRSLHSTVVNIALTRRNHKNNVELFLQGLGKLYNAGFQPDIAKLYPPVQFPVSRGTRMISPRIRWEHSEDWYVVTYTIQKKIESGERQIKIFLKNEDWEYIAGHVIDGRILFPATGYLCLVWETLGMMRGQLFTNMSIIMENIKFHRATTVPKTGELNMIVMIHKGSGRFEVVEGGVAIVTGIIRVMDNSSNEKILTDNLANELQNDEQVMTTKDIYKEFRLRGYQYTGLFQGLRSASLFGTKAYIKWCNNWVAFMDNMLQLRILALDTKSLFVPTEIQKLVIDTEVHQRYIQSQTAKEKDVPAYLSEKFDLITSGGVEVNGLHATSIARKRVPSNAVVEEYKFVAYRDKKEVSLKEILTLSMHISLENYLSNSIKTVELVEDTENIEIEKLASPFLLNILGDLPLYRANVNLYANSTKFNTDKLPANLIISEPQQLSTDGTALLAIGSNLLTEDKHKNLQSLSSSLKENGFLLSREKLNVKLDPSILRKLALDIILEKRTSEESWILLRKKREISRVTLVVSINNDEFSWVDKIKNIMATEEMKIPNYARVILIGEEGFESGLLGFFNCLIREFGSNIFRAVLIQDPEAPKFSLEDPLYSEQLDIDLAVNVLRPGKVWGSYRHLQLPPLEPRPFYHIIASQSVRGDLSSLKWYAGHITKDNQQDDLVYIYYSSINFKDVMQLTSRVYIDKLGFSRKETDYSAGFEFSGIRVDGTRVMGTGSSSLANMKISKSNLIWKIPDSWSLEDAATVPVAYATSIYGFYMRANIKKGQKVLIHSGTGAVGQAAINLALAEGCEVFTTVGTPEKRKFIKEHFPSIDDNHIGNSRDTSFEKLIFRETNGQGVDIVLNSLTEDKLRASIRCLSKHGIFLEIGKFDMMSNNSMDMRHFLNDITFHGVMLDVVLMDLPEMEIQRREIYQILLEGLDKGFVKPLVRQTFEPNQLEKAIRYMTTGKHIGKVIIKLRNEKGQLNEPILALPRYWCSPNKSYVIHGGLGGFGIELIDWLIMRNAKHFVITSRNGIKNGYQRQKVKLWESYGINIVIVTGRDLSKREDCEFVLKTARDLAPVDGIYNLAVVLKDNTFVNQTMENFEISLNAKAWATRSLDEVSRELCPELKHFVVFSSISCGRGNLGQTNYGMANSIMERICEKRAAEGLPALAIQWGAIGEVGLVADMQEVNKELVISGTLQQKLSSCLQELDRFLMEDKTIVASMVVAEKKADVFDSDNMLDCVLNIMGIKDLKSVSQQTPLSELGMDSMMAVEIKQSLERDFDVYLTPQDIRTLNFARIVELNNAQQPKQNKQSVEELISGTKLFLRVYGEKLSTDTLVTLNSNPEPGRSEIFFIPGIEGYGSVFDSLASKIKMPVSCLQLASNYDHDTVPDMANVLLPHLLDKIKDQKEFTLVGYSFGTLLAIELMRQAELKGKNGRLILIDGSPKYMIAMTKEHIFSLNRNPESSILHGIMEIYSVKEIPEYMMELDSLDTWDKKVNKFLEKMPLEYKTLRSEQHYKDSINAFYKRLQATLNYAPKPLPYIKAPITLIKPTRLVVQGLPEDYELQKITKGKLEIHSVEGNHVTLLDNIKVAMIINGEPLEDPKTFKETLFLNSNFADSNTCLNEHTRT